MIREVKFESQDRRIKGIIEALNANGIKDIEEANAICDAAGLDPYKTCEETQPICFENAKWAYVVGAAIAIKKGCKNAADAAEAIGIGLQAFCIPGSVADDRKVGIGHGNLAAMLLREETKCFAFLAGHESFAAAEGAIKIAAKADKVSLATSNTDCGAYSPCMSLGFSRKERPIEMAMLQNVAPKQNCGVACFLIFT